MKRKFLILLLGVLAFSTIVPEANAIRSTKHESFTDPDYVGFRPYKMMVVVDNTNQDARASLLKKIGKKFEDFGVEVIDYRRLFPPTRNWTPEDRARIYEREGVDSVLVVTAGASSYSAIPFATQTYGTTKVRGSTFGNTFSGTANSSSTTYNLYSVKSKADYSAVLIDVSNSRTIWYVDIRTKAGGTLFVGDKRDAKAVAKEIVKALEGDGHIIEAK